MEFLARLEQSVSPDMDPDRLAEIKAAEYARGRELARAGIMRRIWRLPGRRATMVLYDVASIDELHEVISSLPLFPWFDVTITPLGSHQLDPGHGQADNNEEEPP
jgi:muconolactone D-isomerase